MDDAKAASDSTALSLVTFFELEDGDNRQFDALYEAQNFEAPYWQVFFKRYSDILLAPINPEWEFQDSFSYALDLRPIRRVSDKVAIAIEKSFSFDLGDHAGASFELASMLGKLHTIKKLHRTAQKRKEADVEVSLMVKELRSMIRDRVRELTDEKSDAEKYARLIEDRAGFLPEQKLRKITLLIDTSRKKSEILDSANTELGWFLSESEHGGSSPLDEKYDDSAFKIRVETHRKKVLEGQSYSEIEKWLKGAGKASHAGVKKKFVEYSVKMVSDLLRFLSR